MYVCVVRLSNETFHLKKQLTQGLWKLCSLNNIYPMTDHHFWWQEKTEKKFKKTKTKYKQTLARDVLLAENRCRCLWHPCQICYNKKQKRKQFKKDLGPRGFCTLNVDANGIHAH
jgi:hypothetical protein